MKPDPLDAPVLVIARCTCKAEVGRVIYEDQTFQWEHASIEPRADIEVDLEERDEIIFAYRTGSSHAIARQDLADDLLTSERNEDITPPTAAQPLESAPATLHGWCQDHGGSPLARDGLQTAAKKARRDGRIRHVLVQR